MNDLKLIVMDNIKEVGLEIDEFLKKMNRNDKTYIMDVNCIRFNNGEGKVSIEETTGPKFINWSIIIATIS